ncbi:structural maintenance of chromosomes 2-like [Raphidocelis subcapitata]|uniref:Structural maintenance of chromosomes protein n=1 Tax=Raphidocelis subcapitata TaxID=307507 RepID=A0A2V0NR38_9CHLO|nr:structural maintenance of chromosomes 2-like [Raphidocelis subcapitata]|eukprot:GBF88023.1 structural maintenance of chromosomes 2-like [Raphidocelis subcapitata]
MYIKEVSIDGFKSYAQRVTLSNFDPGFNAITGLNGSGKSNILDSICFVMGIKNLAQVRAGSLQELVYKQGSAGITKASVSITFHNDDPANGPSGYEDKELITVTRQIVIGGRDKYLINGHAAQQGRVADLFQSVQLNVNNPHFLIMQGRVTKIMNMKPPEILSLLEEASGTKLYERKKEGALRTLSKKQTKLDEIDQLMNDELLPTLKLLERQCAQYHEYAVTSQAYERLKRFCVAHEYSICLRALESGQGELEALLSEAAALDARRAALESEAADRASEVAALQTEKELQAGGEVKELQEEVDRLAMKLAKDQAEVKNRQDTLAGEAAALAALEAQLAELGEAGLAARVAAARAARDEAAASLSAAERAVEAATRELAGAEAGDGRDESNKSAQERLADAANAQTAAEAEIKACDVKLKLLAKQAESQRKALAAKGKEASKLQAELATAQKKVDAAASKLSSLGFDAAEAEALEAARAEQAAAVRAARDAVEALAAKAVRLVQHQHGQLPSSLDFQFKDPERGFDRERVKGVVAKLVRVRDPATATALEVVAGGRLYQVVVDSDATGRALLAKGALQKRVTIIPLNQIRYRDDPAAVLSAAAKLGAGRARPALELVGFDGGVEAAIKYVFGGAFVCADAATAKKLAFSRDVERRCVTLEGDDFNPKGLLTGGARQQGGCVLAALTELLAAEERLSEAGARLKETEARLAATAAAGKEFRKLHQELELQRHSLSLLQERVAGSESSQLAESLAATEAEAEAARAAKDAAAARRSEMGQMAKALEKEISELSRDRTARVKSAKEKLKSAKSALEAARKAARASEAALNEAEAEAEAAAGARGRVEGEIKEAKAGVAAMEVELAKLQGAVDAASAAHGAAAERLQSKRARLKECDAEIRSLERACAALQSQLQDLEVERRRLDSRTASKRSEQGGAQDRMRRLEEDFEWIGREKSNFGKPRGEFDFAAVDPAKAYAEYEDTGARLAALRERGVEKQADAMYRRNKEEVEALQAKRQQVEADRQQIAAVIQQLDDKKRDALESTWKKVSESFGAIFSSLLPGTEARLVPPEGGTFLDGLEVRVAFGGVWKESLTELSGGQRSLLALSLVLALCRFKPAPIYILDEVDAALDLNHTQNIGAMIKRHFPESQFVVVSLKEGMFNNANVLFRTKFVDGVSTVARYEGGGGGGGAARGGENAARGKAAAAAGGGDGGGGARGRKALREANAALA